MKMFSRGGVRLPVVLPVGLKNVLPVICIVSLASPALADQMHYRNVITGERAQGMGGAYAGISDDASGVFYNPGGLAFAQSNDISGSANAFYSKKMTYKKAVLGVDDWKEESGGTFAPFFGVMQKLDRIMPGLVGGFAYYTLDTELKDQDSLLLNRGNLARYHRAANQRAATFGATGALGYRVSSSMGIGLSVGYLKADELVQVSQNYYTANGSNYLMRSVRESLVAHGAQLGLGIQWSASTQLSLGLSARTGSYASQKYLNTTDNLQIDNGTITSAPNEFKSNNPLGSMPLEMRAGAAWFASPRLIVTTDVDWHEAVTDMDRNTSKIFTRDSVLNYAIGTEYYLTSSIPLRAGYFTNNDATPTPSSSKTDQPDHVDYQGVSLFLAWAQPNSQVSAGAVLQKGKGKSQKVAGDKATQSVDAFAYTLGFSATHSF